VHSGSVAAVGERVRVTREYPKETEDTEVIDVTVFGMQEQSTVRIVTEDVEPMPADAGDTVDEVLDGS
jgi:hypothetical protein